MLNEENELDVRFVEALERIGRELMLLGNAGAITEAGAELGAIENLAMELRDGLGFIAEKLDEQR